MKASKLITAIIGITFLWGCKDRSHIKAYLTSSDQDSIIIGMYMLEAKDSNYIKHIFDDPFDQRITHKRKHYSESVYQAKMNAMKRISEKEPPKQITRNPDSTIIEFYRSWAIEHGYLDR